MKNQKWLIATITVLSVIFTTGMLKTSASAATVQTQDVYRLYNYNTGEHFYTVNNAEKTNLQNAGWSYEGIGWVGATTGTPVYRVYNPNAKGGDHYYTMSKYEAQSLVNKGWRWDNGGKPAFYSAGNTNLYVAYNPNAQSGSHNYTTSTSEESSLVSAGWKYAQVAWKVEGVGKNVAPVKTPFHVVYYSQLDPRWSGVVVGDYTFGSEGCAMTVAAMVVTGYGNTITPLQAGTVGYNVGTFNKGEGGTDEATLIKTFQYYGIHVNTLSSETSMVSQLQQGNPIAIAVQSPFATVVNSANTHELMLYGYSNGSTQVYDPWNNYASGSTSIDYLWNCRSRAAGDINISGYAIMALTK